MRYYLDYLDIAGLVIRDPHMMIDVSMRYIVKGNNLLQLGSPFKRFCCLCVYRMYCTNLMIKPILLE